jgi:hypothetical protein
MDLARRESEPTAEASAKPPSPPTATAAKPGTSADVPRWLRRLSLAVYILFCLEMGMLLLVLPWTSVWLNNSLVAGHSHLEALATNDFVRGAVSGLGLVDIWLAISEALRYRAQRAHSSPPPGS